MEKFTLQHEENKSGNALSLAPSNTEPEQIQNEKQSVEQRFDHALKILNTSSGNSEIRIIGLTGKLDQLDSYLRNNENSLSPEETEYLNASIALKTSVQKRIFKK